MSGISCKKDEAWLDHALLDLSHLGYAVVEDVLDAAFVQRTREAMYAVRRAIHAEVGEARLARAGEVGILRLMLKYDPHFFAFLTIPELLAVVDQTVSTTAILHLQNGFILPSARRGEAPDVFQTRFHMDFPRVLNGYLASINVMFAIDSFTASNGATLVVPGTHQRPAPPGPDYLRTHAVPVECAAGAMILFDSTLWHAGGPNTSEGDRLAINHQFTRSYFKQQIDYVRALGDTTILRQPPRTQQLLGWYARVPTSLDEYYRPEAERLYRRQQG
jgi:ectoine hydroxylase-related dioxygenase (phytanoyl-CoA dioxygenase family)